MLVLFPGQAQAFRVNSLNQDWCVVVFSSTAVTLVQNNHYHSLLVDWAGQITLVS